MVGTGLISRAEIAAALAKAARMGALLPGEAEAALETFRVEWPDFIRIQITEALVARAASLAWQYGLRGYDAVHLAAALTWQEGRANPSPWPLLTGGCGNLPVRAVCSFSRTICQPCWLHGRACDETRMLQRWSKQSCLTDTDSWLILYWR